MTTPTYEVGVIGGLASFDLILAENLSRRGFNCTVTVGRGELERRSSLPPEDIYRAYDRTHTQTYANPRDIVRWAKHCRLIVSLTGALAFTLRELWPLRSLLGLPPIVNFSTGSDVAELSIQRSLRAAIYRQYVRFVDLNWLAPYPHAIENMIRLRIPNVVFMGFPFELSRSETDVTPHPAASATEDLRIFHPAHHDWGLNDPGVHRVSKKGNDRFIRAFARAVREGLRARCVMLERGPDCLAARSLVRATGIEDAVTWKPHLSRQELYAEYTAADVVADQFDVGGLGGIAIEAMSLGKPVMMYVDDSAARLQYDRVPPVLNCSTEDQIHRVLTACADRGHLADVGMAAREWAIEHHRWDRCLDRFIFHYATLTGDSNAFRRLRGAEVSPKYVQGLDV